MDTRKNIELKIIFWTIAAVFSLFLALPLLVLLGRSFVGDQGVTLEFYRSVIADRKFLPALGNSFLVAAAAALDVAANLMLARSDGFKKRLIGIAALALVGLAFYCLSLAVQYMDLAVAYSMWGSLGILGTSLCGWLCQRLKPCAFAGMGLLIIGMILLRTS